LRTAADLLDVIQLVRSPAAVLVEGEAQRNAVPRVYVGCATCAMARRRPFPPAREPGAVRGSADGRGGELVVPPLASARDLGSLGTNTAAGAALPNAVELLERRARRGRGA
jgi:hypothetical protein